jgi:hypothetical protein
MKGEVRVKQARCASCGDGMDQEHSENWKLYCTKDKCREAFMKEVLGKKGGKRNV